MSNKTRKHIWPVSVVMSIAIIGALAAFLVLAAAPGETDAHGGTPHDCSGLSAVNQGVHDAFANPGDDLCSDSGDGGNGNGDNGMTDDAVHATMPMAYDLQTLDNGARLDWEMPKTTAPGATVVGYRIDRDAWNSNAMNPINMYGDTTIDLHEATPTDLSDLGLAYRTTYTYMVRAIVEYDVEHWWNNLNCVMMNGVVMPTADEPQVGPDTAGTAPYCVMYDDLSDGAKAVVHRAYAKQAGKYPDYGSYGRYALGEWTAKRSVTTADSGGRLMALLDPPTAVKMLSATPACADRVSVMWQAPDDFGTVPATDDNGVYVGPDYIGGNRAGKEEVGTNATSVTYQVQRMANNGVWADVTPVGMTYTDTNVAYENSYKYRVRAMNGAGLYGPWTMVTENLTEPDEPQMPRSLNVDPVNGTVELQWDPPTDTEGLWRTMADFDRAGDESGNLQYIVQRKVGNGNWQTLPIENPPKMATQYHKYADNFADTLTQAYTDTSPPVGLVSYRVAALVHGCNPSPFNQKDPVTIVAQPLGSATGLSATAGATAGTADLTWTSGTSSTRHWLAGVKVSDWEAGDFSNMIWRATTGQSSDTVTGLTSGAQYAFTVLSGGANSWDGTWAPIQRVTPN